MADPAFAVTNRPYFMQAGPTDTDIVYTADDFRLFQSIVLHRTGILDAGAMRVTQADVVGMKIKVAVGAASLGAGQSGVYAVMLPGPVEISVASFNTAPPGLRTHAVWVAIYDKLLSAIGDYSGRIVVTEDTGGGAPDPQSLTWNGGAITSLQLATFTLGPGQSNIQNANILNDTLHGGMAGGFISLGNPTYLNTGFSDNATSGTAGFRVLYANGAVRLSGSIKRTTAGQMFTAAGSPYVIGRMHPHYRPKLDRYLTCATTLDADKGSPYTCRLKIEYDGTMTLNMAVGQSCSAVIFDGVSYDID